MSVYREQKAIEDLNNRCQSYKDRYKSNFIIKIKLLFFILRNIFTFSKYKSLKDDYIHILFRLGGGIGDIIIALNYIYIIEQNLKEKIIIDVLVSDEFYNSVNIILKNSNLKYTNVKTPKKLTNKYDFVADLVRIPVIKYANLDKIGRISSKFLEFTNLLIDFKKHNPHYLNMGTTEEIACRDYTIIQKRNRENQANIENFWEVKSILKISSNKYSKILDKINLYNKKIITVQRGVGFVDNVKPDCSTRIWSLEKYQDTIKLLKEKYSDCIVIQIGSENCVPINNVDENLCGKTDFYELIALLDIAFLHFDCECGMVHLRHYICRKPSIVIFGPTKKEFYGYKENINIGNNYCIGCDWLHKNWRTECLRTNDRKFCLEKLYPKDVIDELEKHNL